LLEFREHAVKVLTSVVRAVRPPRLWGRPLLFLARLLSSVR
jgi:hypothetical protein